MYINVKLTQVNTVVLNKNFQLDPNEDIVKFVEHIRNIYFPFAEFSWFEIKENKLD